MYNTDNVTPIITEDIIITKFIQFIEQYVSDTFFFSSQ